MPLVNPRRNIIQVNGDLRGGLPSPRVYGVSNTLQFSPSATKSNGQVYKNWDELYQAAIQTNIPKNIIFGESIGENNIKEGVYDFPNGTTFTAVPRATPIEAVLGENITFYGISAIYNIYFQNNSTSSSPFASKPGEEDKVYNIGGNAAVVTHTPQAAFIHANPNNFYCYLNDSAEIKTGSSPAFKINNNVDSRFYVNNQAVIESDVVDSSLGNVYFLNKSPNTSVNVNQTSVSTLKLGQDKSLTQSEILIFLPNISVLANDSLTLGPYNINDASYFPGTRTISTSIYPKTIGTYTIPGDINVYIVKTNDLSADEYKITIENTTASQFDFDFAVVAALKQPIIRLLFPTREYTYVNKRLQSTFWSKVKFTDKVRSIQNCPNSINNCWALLISSRHNKIVFFRYFRICFHEP